jgi:HAD superfamily hydrolase (TIGR01509 family)
MSSGKKTANINSFCVIFDVDGTMVDNAAYHQKAWIELGKLYDLPITEDYYKSNIHARSNEQIVKTLYNNDTVDKELTQRIERDKEGIYRKLYRPHLKEIPGLTDLIEALKENAVPCAVASNSPKENVDMVLDELDIRKYIDLVIDCNQVKKGKPDPEALLTIASNLGFLPQNCLVFEDSPSGIKAAENAEMPCIIITAGAHIEINELNAIPVAVHKDFTGIKVSALAELL